MLKNDLILKAARGEQVERVPIWLMRQAGRILPEYRATRAKAKNFIEFVKNPELACEVTIQPVDILGVDAAIIFSDILVIPEAMGLPYQMIEAKGPWFENTIKNKADVDAMRIANAGDLDYVIQALRLAKQGLNGRVPLIGFCGAPWTILSYMVEGSGSKTFSKAKQFLYTQPELAHALLDKITKSSINYLKGQIEAGADMVQLFDSWAGVLSEKQYYEFGLKYISQIVEAIKPLAPVTVFAKDAHYALKKISETNCSTIGLDWTIDPAKARTEAGKNVTLQGNTDPCLLYADEKTISKETEIMLKAFGKQRYICNLGHGLYPDIDKEKVKFFVNFVKEFKV
ncbi:MAG: uroporphyrinogen decarboxylase [Bacteroidia bacterium]|jgi:uroporphyrinogen decarboxylase|nr:uroporphyrinogen decarboxylase [Sphingobacteriaceae bacterium]MBK7311082.1 uroporphyrinogen decarboxylase [Sphingobacteriaceae bacterium]MBP9069511.1 uroporphyrinogen decarboxylase [Bacteroidia bacterium]